jgi:hypothetical protein
MSSKHLSTVRISDKEFFYTSRMNAMKAEGDTYNKFSLFAIKYVRDGPLSDDVMSLRKVDPAHCFELITEDRYRHRLCCCTCSWLYVLLAVRSVEVGSRKYGTLHSYLDVTQLLFFSFVICSHLSLPLLILLFHSHHHFLFLIFLL